MAGAASEAKDRLLAIVAEDSAVTLNAVLGWTRMLRREVLDSAARQMALAVIEGNVERHLALVSELVDVARVLEGEVQFELRHVSVGSVLDRAIERAAGFASERGVSVAVSRGTDARILGDAARLARLVVAAIESCLETALHGEELSIEAGAVDGLVAIRVRGGGASQPVSSSRHPLQAPGTGSVTHSTAELGFLLVERIARLHGGEATVSSDEHGRRVIEARLPQLGASSSVRASPALVEAITRRNNSA
jgi:signal transduction histidine kinase